MTKKHLVFVSMCFMLSLFVSAATAQVRLAGGVFSNAGASLSSSSGQLVFTVGQPLVGSTQGLSAGFWQGAGRAARPTAVEEDPADTTIPQAFHLNQNYPNPFNPTTTISYGLAEPSTVLLEMFNVLGQKIRTLVTAHQTAGTYSIQWDACTDDGLPVSSGIYIYRLQAGDFVQVRQMLLLK